MKTSLKHLPEEKQKQILELVKIIKQVSPVMIILHGSYAKGSWQQGWSTEKNAVLDFNSDFDLMVIMKDGDEIKEMSLTDKLNNTLRNHTPVDVMVHSIAQINNYLEKGHYFFADIIATGILLFDSGEVLLSKPKELTNDERRQLALEYFDFWFPLSKKYLKVAISDFQESVENGDRLNFSMHNLFQATEGLYTTFSLVFTGFKPKTHNLDKFRSYTKDISEKFDSVFPKKPKDKYDADLFELLKRSYVGAKYKLDFYIAQKDLEQLIKKVSELLKIVEKVCKEQISSFESN